MLARKDRVEVCNRLTEVMGYAPGQRQRAPCAGHAQLQGASACANAVSKFYNPPVLHIEGRR